MYPSEQVQLLSHRESEGTWGGEVLAHQVPPGHREGEQQLPSSVYARIVLATSFQPISQLGGDPTPHPSLGGWVPELLGQVLSAASLQGLAVITAVWTELSGF